MECGVKYVVDWWVIFITARPSASWSLEIEKVIIIKNRDTCIKLGMKKMFTCYKFK